MNARLVHAVYMCTAPPGRCATRVAEGSSPPPPLQAQHNPAAGVDHHCPRLTLTVRQHSAARAAVPHTTLPLRAALPCGRGTGRTLRQPLAAFLHVILTCVTVKHASAWGGGDAGRDLLLHATALKSLCLSVESHRFAHAHAICLLDRFRGRV
jgi:hypothetical protein